MRAEIHATILLSLVASFPCHADGDCAGRAPNAAEAAAYRAMAEAFRKAAPPAPAGWRSEDSPAHDRLEAVCRDSDGGPLRATFRREYRLQAGLAERDRQAQTASEATARKASQGQQANAARIAVIDQRIADLTRRMEQDAANARYARLEPLVREIEQLSAEKLRLSGARELEAEIAGIQSRRDQDTEATLELQFNAGSETTGDYTRFTQSGTSRAYRFTHRDPNPTEEVALYFGAWEVDGDRVFPAGDNMVGKPFARLHNAAARLRGAPQRVDGLLKSGAWGAIQAAIGK